MIDEISKRIDEILKREAVLLGALRGLQRDMSDMESRIQRRADETASLQRRIDVVASRGGPPHDVR